MGDRQTAAEAAAELAGIQRRQEQVIKAVIIPNGYWWAMAAAIVAIGVARDNGNPVVQAIVIPLAALVIVGLIVATNPTWRRRVRVNNATTIDGRDGAAIVVMIVLVDAVIIGLAAGLGAAHVRYPITIGSIAGSAVFVIVGPLVNRHRHARMLRAASQQLTSS